MSAKKNKREDYKQEDVLQAVVVADSFNIRFGPVTRNKPKVLLPLVNTPLLDYTLEFLCDAGIEDIIVFCCAHIGLVKAHLENSKWSGERSSCNIRTIASENCLSMGDALREIDSRSLIQSDFVLVYGDLVSNMQLSQAIQRHKERRQRLKTPMMSMVFKHASPGHRSRCREDEILVAISQENDRILHYQKVAKHKKFQFPLDIFQENSSIQLHYDLLDCHVSICSPQVPQLFTDNFDYLTREDFVRGILVNEEILGNTIHAHIIEDEYAARVSNLRMYDAISQDILSRWCYPLVPERHLDNCSSYSYGRHNIYRDRDVTLARGCVLQKNVVIGSGTSVGSNSTIAHSVIGKNCKIGNNCDIKGSYIWNNVHIEDNCIIKTTILSDRVTIKNGVTIKEGCVIAEDVTLGPDVSLPPATMLTATGGAGGNDDGFSDDESPSVADSSVIGSEGVAYIYQTAAESGDESLDEVEDVWGLPVQSDEESSDESIASGRSSPTSPIIDDTRLFYAEVLDTLERARQEHIGNDNIVLEINSLKHAYNISIKEVNQFVVKAVVEFPQKNVDDIATYYSKLKEMMSQWIPLLKNYLKSTESQLDALVSLEDFADINDLFLSVLVKVLHQLYDNDVFEENVILQWYENVQEAKIRKQVWPFIKWLREAEEEESD